jgi:hypothetical protein
VVYRLMGIWSRPKEGLEEALRGADGQREAAEAVPAGTQA